jgi:hypothetical protein
MDAFLLDCCFKSCGTQLKFSQLTPRSAILTLRYATKHGAMTLRYVEQRGVFSPRIADEL